MRRKTRFISLLLAIILCVGLLPTIALADDTWAEGSLNVQIHWASPDKYRDTWQYPIGGIPAWFVGLTGLSNATAELYDKNDELVGSFTGEAYTFTGLKAGTYKLCMTVLDNEQYVPLHGATNGGQIPYLVTERDSYVTIEEGNTKTVYRWLALENKAYGFKTVTDRGQFENGTGEKIYYTGENMFFEKEGRIYNSHNGIYYGDHASQYSDMTSLEEPTLSQGDIDAGWKFKGWTLEGDTSHKVYTTSEALLINVTSNIVLNAVFERTGYTVTWKNGGDTLETDEYVQENTAPSYDDSKPTKTINGEAQVFTGWSKNPDALYGIDEADLQPVTKDVTYYAIFQPPASSGRTIIKVEKTKTEGNVDTYTIYYSDDTTYEFTITNGKDGRDGSDGRDGKDGRDGVDGKDGNCVLVPEDLNGEDHFAYIIGYPDGNVHPEGTITRAEVATIFFRLLEDNVRDAYFTRTNSFSDVKEGQWYNNAISTMAKMGILKGYKDGTFKPNENITRAEFAAIAARFDKTASSNLPIFTDTYGHWAASEIGNAAKNGWVNGYPDGSFKPNQAITRAEAMALVNRVLNRDPQNPADLLNSMIKWPDNMDTNKWYYLDVQEATNSHDYERTTQATEKWTALQQPRNWASLEK